MVLVLYVVAGLMAVGGLAAMYSGSDIIVMERGWTMVIAGSVIAASGALLAGIATAVARLQGLGEEFARLSDRLGPPQEPALARSSDRTPENRASVEGSKAASPTVFPDLVAHRDLEVTPEPLLGPTPPSAPRAEIIPAHAVALSEPAVTMAEEADETPVPELEPASTASAVEAVTEPPEPTIVGTYNSGGNFYIMYSDGSIEAETPAGKFRFDSLDELKDFIARGGDKVRAGTPSL